MIKKSYIEIESFYGSKVDNLFLTHEEKASSLVVLFPGRRYTCDMPLLHYSRMATLLSGCDVLSLRYGYLEANKDFEADDFDALVKEICDVICKCNLDTYKKLYFISKSLGTLFAGEVTMQMSGRNIKNLYLTPLDKTIPYLMNTNCIAVTGSADKAFPDASRNSLLSKSDHKIVIIDGADHRLETDISTAKNLEILQQIVSICEQFVSKT